MSKNFEEMSKDELIDLVNNLLKRKKFGLVWEDKPEKVAQLCNDNFPVLDEIEAKALLKYPEKATNFLIEGDNYHSLSVLNYTHAGKIDLIAIDPPYNTGSNDFVYNDQYVDREDTFRHSKWLSFMEKRLKLAQTLLSDAGVLVMNIDENEFAQLKMLSDQIFGESNYLMDVIWNSRKSVSNDAIISLNHNHTLIYAKNISSIRALNKKGLRFKLSTQEHKFSNIDNDPRGSWSADPFDAPGIRPNLTYPITNPNTGVVYMPPAGRCWRTSEEEYLKFLADGMIVFGKKGNSKPQLKRYLSDASDKGMTPKSIWDDIGTTTNGTQELEAILGYKAFNNPKPLSLLERVIELATDKQSIVLDFFAGSGTTGHAVLRKNAEDGGSRTFILCTNNENDIAENITYQRIKTAIDGYKDNQPLEANLRYFKTAFVAKQKNDDQTRQELVDKSTEMICLREDTFELVVNAPDFKIYAGHNSYSAVVFDPDSIEALKVKIEQLPGESEVAIYAFSLSNDTYQSDFKDLTRKHVLRAIPEGILEVYRRLFNNQTSLGD